MTCEDTGVATGMAQYACSGVVDKTRMVEDGTALPSAIARDTPLYRVFNGKLEVVRFVQKQILEGASKPTYIVRQADRKALVAVDYYHATLQEAWAEEIDNLETGIPRIEQQILDLQKSVVDFKEQLERAKLECTSPKAGDVST